MSLADVARRFRDAFTYDPGHSDLDDEQPISISITLGDWRKLDIALSEKGTNSAAQVHLGMGDDVRDTAGSLPVEPPQPARAESPDKEQTLRSDEAQEALELMATLADEFGLPLGTTVKQVANHALYLQQERARLLSSARGDIQETLRDALAYINHVGSSHVMRGQPHPQEWLVKKLEVAISQYVGEKK